MVDAEHSMARAERECGSEVLHLVLIAHCQISIFRNRQAGRFTIYV
jgi:hypothetical protein